ncbi:MAG: hypothetical protein H6738_20090 [Alphaproteobacteria bacterium]|nr:hypothetical protein [Alphaproteobacteria bacterium]MCB9699093.1 hypothetical protein [Alphaproteobacteria bacterium]
MVWLWLVGCLSSDWAEALDYHIDRTLIPAMRVTPRVAPGGIPRTFEALVLSPGAVQAPTWEVCGLYEGRTARIDEECFEEPSLITPIGTGERTTWTPPSIDVACSYDHTGIARDCWSSFPVRAVAEGPGGVGRAVLPLSVMPDDSVVWEVAGPSPVRIEVVEGAPAPGAEVLLEATTTGEDRGQVFRWYVDDGVLLGTGRTAPWTVGGGRVTAHNRLRIPQKYDGRLRVVVVVDQDGEQSWAVKALQVTP